MPFVFRGKLLGYFGAWYHFEPMVRASKALKSRGGVVSGMTEVQGIAKI